MPPELEKTEVGARADYKEREPLALVLVRLLGERARPPEVPEPEARVPEREREPEPDSSPERDCIEPKPVASLRGRRPGPPISPLRIPEPTRASLLSTPGRSR